MGSEMCIRDRFLFFVLSAYLLDRQIAVVLLAGKGSMRYWLYYFLRRFLRIYPLFIVSLLIFYYINGPIKTVEDVYNHLLLLEGKSVFWSISVEFKYYFLSPFLLLFCHKVLKWDPKKLFVFFLLLLMASIYYGQTQGVPKLSIIKYLPIFLMGTVFSIYELLKIKYFEGKDYSKIVEVLGWGGVGLIIISGSYYFELIFGYSRNFFGAKWFLPFGLAMLAMLISAKHGYGLMRKILEFKPLRFLGTISYSLYLLHLPVMYMTRRLPLPMPFEERIFYFSGLVLLVSCISYLLIELSLIHI